MLAVIDFPLMLRCPEVVMPLTCFVSGKLGAFQLSKFSPKGEFFQSVAQQCTGGLVQVSPCRK